MTGVRTIACARCARKFATDAALAKHAADTHDNPVLAEMVAELRDALENLIADPIGSAANDYVEARAVLKAAGALLDGVEHRTLPE